MSKQHLFNPKRSLSVAVGAAVVGTLAMAPAAATANPFAMTELASGYMVGANHSGEGSCGGKMQGDAGCGGDKADAAKHHQEGGCGGHKGIDKHFKDVDGDGDGMISSAEHAAHAQSMFEHADANGDGMVSRDEVGAAMKARHKGKHAEGTCGEGSCGGAKSDGSKDDAKPMKSMSGMDHDGG